VRPDHSLQPAVHRARRARGFAGFRQHSHAGPHARSAECRRPENSRRRSRGPKRHAEEWEGTVCLWHSGEAEDAARFDAATVPDSSVGAIHRAPGDCPSGREAQVLTVLVTALGIPCLGLTGGPAFKRTASCQVRAAPWFMMRCTGLASSQSLADGVRRPSRRRAHSQTGRTSQLSRSQGRMIMTPSTVEEYIASQPSPVQAVLRAVWATARNAAPQAQERISYRMPALFQNGVVVYVGAFKHHLGVFPPVTDPRLRQQVAPYAGPKGNLQFPYAQPVPLDLIAEVVSARLEANLGQPTRRRTAAAGASGKGSAGGRDAVQPVASDLAALSRDIRRETGHT